MDRVAPILVAALAVLALGVSPAPVRAQAANTTFVSGFGSDANPCTVAAPCRSFAAAILVTAAGGQITMLDPAGYGAVTITKAIAIVNDGGGEAGITDPGSGSDAITINAGASDVVTLRGLTLNGVGTGRHGIAFNSGGALNIQNCVIRDFAGFGVDFAPSASAAIVVSDTTVSNTGDGIEVAPSSGTVTAYLRRVTAVGNGGGISLVAGTGATINGAIVDSTATGNSAFGIITRSNPGAVITLVNSKVIGNGIGLSVANASTMAMSQTTLSGNTTGFAAGPTFLQTFGDNYIIDTNNQGTLTPIGLQ